MRRRPGRALGLVLAVSMAAAGCGKKGSPLPPLRPVPARIGDFAAHQVDGRVELSFTVPGNADETEPPAVTSVEIYRVATALGAPPPNAAQIFATAKAPFVEVRVRQPADAARQRETARSVTASGPVPASQTLDPAAGEAAVVVDTIDAARAQGAGTWSYVVVGVAGRNRRGPLSGALHVPLTALPDPPAGLRVTATETLLRVTWDALPAGTTSVRVLSIDRPVDSATAGAIVVTPQPVSGTEFAMPVEFGRERCLAARTVTVAGGVTIEGPVSAPICLTPMDVYPPAAPAGLQAIQEGASVTLNWTGVEAADLAGYVVLRGDGDGVMMRPLTVTPVKETTYSDRTVSAGATYTYSVYAVDTAAVPNVSEQSNRYTVTVR